MTTTGDFMFNNMGRLGSDITDNSQKNISNERFSQYTLENYFGGNTEMVHFATSQPTINFRGNGGGNGLSGSVVDFESNLSIEAQQDRELEKVQLFQRPFLTVPYLGRGSVNPVLESQLQQGEVNLDKKSMATITTLPNMSYDNYPIMDSVKNRVTNPSYSVEEIGMDGWTRGGTSSRDIMEKTNYQR
jgi:hypothetical protein